VARGFATGAGVAVPARPVPELALAGVVVAAWVAGRSVTVGVNAAAGAAFTFTSGVIAALSVAVTRGVAAPVAAAVAVAVIALVSAAAGVPISATTAGVALSSADDGEGVG